MKKHRKNPEEPFSTAHDQKPRQRLSPVLHKVKSLDLHAAAGHEAGADGFIDGPQPVGGQLHAARQGLARQVQAVAQEKKRIFVTLDKGLSYFISLVYTEHGLALGTAFPPDGEWLRKMQASSTLLGP